MKEILQCDQEQLQRTKHELQCRFMGNIREQASRLHKMLIEVVNCFVQEWEEVQIRQFVNVDQLVYCG